MKHIVFRILSGLVLIAVIAGIALLAYNAGVTRGTSLNVQVPAGQNGSQAYPVYGMPLWWPFPFFGFSFFGLLALFFLLSVAFGAFRFMLFGPRFGWHMMHRRYGAWGDRGSSEGIPPMFAEMHRRMHAAEEGKPADQAAQK
jgi:hypothetical protein